MPNQNVACAFKGIATLALLLLLTNPLSAQLLLRDRLKSHPFQVVYETYVDNNFELFVCDADGANPRNLTQTPTAHEHYPQVSPDGTKICFTVDVGEGRDTIRSLYVMDADGKNRKKLVDYAREPFWAPDSQRIGFLPQEYPKFGVIDYYTKGMSFYDLRTGAITPHPNTTNLHHLYNPTFAPNGKWIAATVHAGMGYDHAILLIAANGTNIINLKIPGCRPNISPDGQKIAWGAEDHELAIAPISLDSETPSVGKRQILVQDMTNKIYHIDWSPDCRYVAFSRGPDGKGDLSKRGSFQAAAEIVGIYGAGWNLYAVSAEREGTLDLNFANPSDYAVLTTNGLSNKEPAWLRRK